MMKIGIEIKKTTELTGDEIQKIVILKNRYWKHDREEHIKWFDENIEPEDLHLLIQDRNSLRAYLNIVHVDVMVDQNFYKMMGIGNVCVDKEHSGMGTIMMTCVNAFIKDMNSCGILLCRNDLVQFYEKSNWKKYNVSEAFIVDHAFMNIVMKYDPYGKLPDNAEEILFSRNF